MWRVNIDPILSDSDPEVENQDSPNDSEEEEVQTLIQVQAQNTIEQRLEVLQEIHQECNMEEELNQLREHIDQLMQERDEAHNAVPAQNPVPPQGLQHVVNLKPE